MNVSPRASLAALVASVLSIATSLVPLVTHYADVAHVLGDTWAAVIVALGAVAIAAACICAAGHSILHLFPRYDAEHDGATAPIAPPPVAAEEKPMSAITDAIKPLAALAIATIKNVFDAEAPALAADVEKAAPARVQLIANEIEAGLPKNGILANAESAVVKKAIDQAAAALDAQIPAGVTFLEGVVDRELSQLEKNLGG